MRKLSGIARADDALSENRMSLPVWQCAFVLGNMPPGKGLCDMVCLRKYTQKVSNKKGEKMD